METVSPDIAQKILNRDFANIVSRVQSGGKLTRQERAMLQSMAVGAGGDKPDTANSYVELAKILGVTRQSLDRWRKRKDAPKPTANGTHNVVLWREYMKRNDLKGGEGNDSRLVRTSPRLELLVNHYNKFEMLLEASAPVGIPFFNGQLVGLANPPSANLIQAGKVGDIAAVGGVFGFGLVFLAGDRSAGIDRLAQSGDAHAVFICQGEPFFLVLGVFEFGDDAVVGEV
jgi:hypothetical protein